MKRKGRFEIRTVHRVRLYLDDYFELVDILGREGRELKITADDYALETPEEIKELHQPVVRRLNLTSTRKFDPNSVERASWSIPVTVNVGRFNASVEFSNSTDVDCGRALQCLEILHKRKSKQLLIWKIARWIPAVLIVLFSQYVALTHGKSQVPLLVGLAIVAGAILAFLLPFWEFRPWIPDSEKGIALILKRRSEETNFWSRNKDDLITKAIIAVLGLAGGWALKSLWPH